MYGYDGYLISLSQSKVRPFSKIKPVFFSRVWFTKKVDSGKNINNFGWYRYIFKVNYRPLLFIAK